MSGLQRTSTRSGVLSLMCIGFCAAGASGQPALRMVSPNGGEVYGAGDTITIRWEANFDSLQNGVVLGISPDRGKHWVYLYAPGNQLIQRTSLYYRGNQGAFVWIIPTALEDDFGAAVSLLSDSCIMGVHAIYDLDPTAPRGWKADLSDGTIAIGPRLNVKNSRRSVPARGGGGVRGRSGAGRARPLYRATAVSLDGRVLEQVNQPMRAGH